MIQLLANRKASAKNFRRLHVLYAAASIFGVSTNYALAQTSLANSANVVADAAFWRLTDQGHLQSGDRLELAYVAAIPPSPKAAIILVQGRTEAYLKYAELIQQLYQRGFAVFSLDHRGQGLSARLLADRQIGHVGNFVDYLQDQQLFMHQVVQPALQKQPHMPRYLLAHSMGGAVAAQWLAQEPFLFQAAVLSSPMIAPNTKVAFSEKDGCVLADVFDWSCPDCYAGFVAQPYAEQDFSENILTRSKERYLQFRALYQQQPELQLGGPSWHWVSEACTVANDMPELAKKIQTPVLLLQSGDEKAVSNHAQNMFCQDLAAHCEGQRVVSFANTLHEIWFAPDDVRDQALQALLDFYQKYP